MKWINCNEKTPTIDAVVRRIGYTDTMCSGNYKDNLRKRLINAIDYEWLDESPSDVSILVKGFEKIIGIVKRYRDHDGQSSIGNHIENECKEILAQYSTLTGEAGKESEVNQDCGSTKYLIEDLRTGKWLCIGEPIDTSKDMTEQSESRWTNDPNMAISWNSRKEAEKYNKKYWNMAGIEVTEHEFVDTAPADEIEGSISEGEERRLNRQEDNNELLGKCLNMLRFLYMNEYCGDHGAEVRELITPKPHRKQ